MNAPSRWFRHMQLRVRLRHAAPILAIGICALAWAVLGSVSSASAQSYNGGLGSSDRYEAEQDYHVVQEGETLYDLAYRYFGDRKQWPKLWSYNPQITNPHWIYPGDVVYLRPPEEVDRVRQTSTGEVQQTASGGGGEGSIDIQNREAAKKGLLFDVAGMVVEDHPEFVGRIVGSPKEARMLGEYDRVWVGFGDEGNAGDVYYDSRRRHRAKIRDPGKVERKARFAIVKDAGIVEDMEGYDVGHKYYVIGTLVVTKTSKDTLETAYIDQAWQEIERGDLLLPYERQLKRVTHVPADQDVVLEIVDTLRKTTQFGEFSYVFLNKGASHGVRAGNRGYVYQRRSGLPKRWNDTPDLPWLRVGRVRVIDVTEKFSTAIITKSKREIALGDRVEMYKGN